MKVCVFPLDLNFKYNPYQYFFCCLMYLCKLFPLPAVMMYTKLNARSKVCEMHKKKGFKKSDSDLNSAQALLICYLFLQKNLSTNQMYKAITQPNKKPICNK